MAAPLLSPDGHVSIGADPQSFESPHAESTIAGQFAALEATRMSIDTTRPAQGHPPAEQAPGQLAPVTLDAQDADIPQEEDDDGLVSTSADLASVFDGVESADQLFSSITHTVGDRDYTLSQIVAGFAAQPEAAELAAQRETHQDTLAQESQAHRVALDSAMDQVTTLLSDLESKLNADENPQYLAQLLHRDPVAYQAKSLEIQTRKATLNNAQLEKDRINEAKDRQLQQEEGQYLAVQNQKLAQRFPEWSDAEQGPIIQGKLKSYATSVGFRPEELSAITDHRFLLVLRDAAMGNAIQKTGVKAIRDAKLRKLPAPASRPGARGDIPGAREQKMSGRAASFQKQQRDGTVDSTAAVFAGLLE